MFWCMCYNYNDGTIWSREPRNTGRTLQLFYDNPSQIKKAKERNCKPLNHSVLNRKFYKITSIISPSIIYIYQESVIPKLPNWRRLLRTAVTYYSQPAPTEAQCFYVRISVQHLLLIRTWSGVNSGHVRYVSRTPDNLISVVTGYMDSFFSSNANVYHPILSLEVRPRF
jgi:hypothetical protein